MRDDLVTVVTPQTEFEANILAIVLKDNGVDAFVFASAGSMLGVYLSGGTFGVPVQVSRDELEKAKQVLLENKRHSIDIDWDELEAVQGEDKPFEPETMPLTARFAFVCVLLALIAGIAVVVLQFIT
jgi:hypothetical protein